MVGPMMSSVPPHSVSSMTTLTRKTLTLTSCNSPQSSTANRSSHWTTFCTFCPKRTHIKFSLLAPIAQDSSRPDLPGRFWGSQSRSVVLSKRSRSRKAVTFMAVAAGDRRVLITFDVDGTLMRSVGESANLLHKKSFSYAMKEVFGIDGNIDVIKHHGSTDPMVLVNTLEYYDVPTKTATAKLPELKSKTLEYAKQNSAQVKEGLELLPGVASILEILSKRKDVVVALVTGNLEDIGWLKMDGLGIRQYFSTPNFGGFGSDDIDRGELVKIAAARAKKFFPGEFSQRVHVGDTPNDIRAAECGGALAIGVCTGVFSRDDLEEASKSGRAVILDDLKDSGIFLKACGLE